VAVIRIARRHGHGLEEARRRITPVIRRTADSYGLRFHWEGDVCLFHGPATGRIAVGEDTVEMDVRLGLAAGLFRASIEREIREALDSALA